MLVIGFLGVFAKDLMWDLTVWQNQMKGIASERTDTWDLMTTIGGIVCIVLALIGIYALLNGAGSM